MADKKEDSQEFHTPKAKFERAAKAVSGTAGEFAGNWKKNIVFRSDKSFGGALMNVNGRLVLAAAAIGGGYALVTDIDPQIDKSHALVNVMSPENAAQGANRMSIVDHNNETFGLIAHNGTFEVYNIEQRDGEDRWTLIEDADTARRIVGAVAGHLDMQLSRNQEDPTYNYFPRSYVPEDGTTISYSAQQNGEIVTQRFGELERTNPNFEQGPVYFGQVRDMWQQAADSISRDTYKLNNLPPFLDQSFNGFSRGYNAYTLLYMTSLLGLIAGSGLVAAGQTGASVVRRARRKKPS